MAAALTDIHAQRFQRDATRLDEHMRRAIQEAAPETAVENATPDMSGSGQDGARTAGQPQDNGSARTAA